MGRTRTAAVAAAFALAFATTAADGEAQTIGFKLGASFANMSASDEAGLDSSGRTGFVGGGFVRFGLGMINLQPEILSVSKGAEFNGAGDDAVTIRLEYIEIPVMLQIPFALGALSPYIVGGPAVAFEIGCNSEGDSVEGDCTEGNSFGRNKTDFGVTAGGGLEFPLGPGALTFEGRYTWGLSNIVDDAAAPAGAELKNRAAYLTAGYTIWLGRRY